MTDHLKPENKALVESVLGYRTARTYNRHEIDRLIDAARAQGPSTSGADEREEIARIIDHEGYWERLDSCNHALATVSMTDEQRRALTAVRDDELRGTASSLAKADAILARAQGPGEAVAWRPEVVAFANLMEAQLRANDHKGGWRGDTAAALHNRLLEEAEELFDALNWRSAFLGDADPERIGSEAADVANFAMMIADVCGALAATPTREGA